METLPQQNLDFDVLSRVIFCLQSEKETEAPTVISLPSSTYRSSCNALLSLARTCRTLKEPSLKALWRRQDHILPVCRLILQLAFEVDGFRPSGYWCLYSPISQDDLKVFDRYASMIQEMHFVPRTHEIGPSDTIHDSVYTYLLSARFMGVFFPNLLIISTVTGPMLHLFASPSLRQMSLSSNSDYKIGLGLGDWEDPWAPNFISRVCSTSHSLHCVLLDSVILNSSALRDVLAISGIRVLQFRLSRSLSFARFQRIITNVPTMHNLQSLSIVCSDSMLDPSNYAEDTAQLRTPNLQFLTIRGTLKNILVLCKSIETRILNSFKASVVHRSAQDIVDGNLEPVYRLLWHRLCALSSNKLESLSIDTDFLLGRPLIDPEMGSHLSPLYQLEYLKHLSFTPIVLKDSDLELMSQSWRYLQHLAIPLRNHSTPAQLTFRGVKMLAERCRHLERLELTLDATDLATIPIILPSQAEERAIPHPLTHMNVGDSPITQECVAAVVALLKAIFPNLNYLFSTFKTEEWGEVCYNVLP